MIPTDVSSQQQVEALVARVDREFGRIDVLINNAGCIAVGPVEGKSFVEDTQQLLATSFFGKVFAARAVLPIMRRQGRGHIVNLSSVVGRKALADFGAYSAAMHAIAAFSDALRQELRSTGIGVSTLHPSLTQTALFDGVDPNAIRRPSGR
ncbi:MAG TPA: SDR family NAD(P)-dependent oxidoreductase [Methylocaldum sp.]|nr:SDR family NAD(P)-dependent oxidoreductase [Methylocaldum sp.]HYE35596.1 SDR family NAD(P)-dependent oxidoreductase [Methylocaldum sp.]